MIQAFGSHGIQTRRLELTARLPLQQFLAAHECVGMLRSIRFRSMARQPPAREPDVICGFHMLTVFEDNNVGEIHAVHGVECFLAVGSRTGNARGRFVNLREEPAQEKLQEPRNSRIEGEKLSRSWR